MYEYEFNETADPRKGIPYVARLVYKNGKIEREFYNMNRAWGKNSITVSGKYTARIGDIIEKRIGASWKNDYRYWYIILDNGEEVKVADISNSREKMVVIEYLKGNIPYEEFKKEILEE